MFLPSVTLTECIVQHSTAKVASNERVPLFFFFSLIVFDFLIYFVAVIRVVEMFIEHLDCPVLKQAYLSLTDTAVTAA